MSELQKDEKIDSLSQLVEHLDVKISKIQIQQEVLKEKLELLRSNNDFGGENGVSLTDLKNAVDFFEDQLLIAKTSGLENRMAIEKIKKKKNRIQLAINSQRNEKLLPTSEIQIKVKAERTTTGEFEISYVAAPCKDLLFVGTVMDDFLVIMKKKGE